MNVYSKLHRDLLDRFQGLHQAEMVFHAVSAFLADIHKIAEGAYLSELDNTAESANPPDTHEMADSD